MVPKNNGSRRSANRADSKTESMLRFATEYPSDLEGNTQEEVDEYLATDLGLEQPQSQRFHVPVDVFSSLFEAVVTVAIQPQATPAKRANKKSNKTETVATPPEPTLPPPKLAHLTPKLHVMFLEVHTPRCETGYILCTPTTVYTDGIEGYLDGLPVTVQIHTQSARATLPLHSLNLSYSKSVKSWGVKGPTHGNQAKVAHGIGSAVTCTPHNSCMGVPANRMNPICSATFLMLPPKTKVTLGKDRVFELTHAAILPTGTFTSDPIEWRLQGCFITETPVDTDKNEEMVNQEESEIEYLIIEGISKTDPLTEVKVVLSDGTIISLRELYMYWNEYGLPINKSSDNLYHETMALMPVLAAMLDTVLMPLVQMTYLTCTSMQIQRIEVCVDVKSILYEEWLSLLTLRTALQPFLVGESTPDPDEFLHHENLEDNKPLGVALLYFLTQGSQLPQRNPFLHLREMYEAGHPAMKKIFALLCIGTDADGRVFLESLGQAATHQQHSERETVVVSLVDLSTVLHPTCAQKCKTVSGQVVKQLLRPFQMEDVRRLGFRWPFLTSPTVNGSTPRYDRKRKKKKTTR